jgi:hypothetical protein
MPLAAKGDVTPEFVRGAYSDAGFTYAHSVHGDMTVCASNDVPLYTYHTRVYHVRAWTNGHLTVDGASLSFDDTWEIAKSVLCADVECMSRCSAQTLMENAINNGYATHLVDTHPGAREICVRVVK